MSEQPTTSPEQQAQEPALHPAYKAAQQDTQIVIRFMGNTARIAGMGFQGEVDPFQMRAAAWLLERQATVMIDAQERDAARRQAMTSIARPGPGSMVPPPGDLRGGLPK